MALLRVSGDFNSDVLVLGGTCQTPPIWQSGILAACSLGRLAWLIQRRLDEALVLFYFWSAGGALGLLLEGSKRRIARVPSGPRPVREAALGRFPRPTHSCQGTFELKEKTNGKEEGS